MSSSSAAALAVGVSGTHTLVQVQRLPETIQSTDVAAGSEK